MPPFRKVWALIIHGEWASTFEDIDYRRAGLSLRARLNIVLQNLSHALRLPISFAIPYYLTVEPASICNLQCPVCPCGLHKTIRNPAILPLADFKRLIDDIGEYLVLIQMWEWGEPFMNPDICEMIAYARRRGIVVICSTNCHFFGEEAVVRKLVDSGLDGLILAVDGATAEVYEKYRVGGDFSRVLAGIQRIVAEKERRGSAKPLLHLRMVINAFNESQIEAFRELGRTLQVDQVAFKTINAGMGGESKNPGILPQDKNLIRKKKARHFQYRCIVSWCNPVLFSNGRIGLCGLACRGETELRATSDTATFLHVWNSREARTFRKNIRADCNHYPFCRECDCREPDFQRARFGVEKVAHRMSSRPT
jgi:MoaA/NifB/PqqE/SkfB family radical SAM enzyme